jgi:serine/threonine protein kinase
MPDATGATSTAPAPAPEASPRSDRLELIQQLSGGSVGVVYKAKNPKIDRVVALRQIQVPEWLDDVEDLLKRMLAEARGANALDHKNIARLYTGGYKGFTVFLTSEFVEGVGLKAYVSSRNSNLPEIMELVKQLCSALDCAHAKNVFHPALNPGNIKVQADGTLKILDFGLLRDKNLYSPTPAKRLENEHYLSPEQVKNKPVDRAANLFTAATIIYELFTTRNPFAGKHLGEVDRNITDVETHPASMAHSRVPESVSKVLMRALLKNPAGRFQSGQELIAALEEAMSAAPAKPAAASATATGQRPVTASIPAAPRPQPASAPTPTAAPAPVKTATVTPVALKTTTTIKPPTSINRKPAPAPGKLPAQLLKQWKLAAIIVGILFVVSAVAISMRHRTQAPPAGSEDISAQTEKTTTSDSSGQPAPSVQVHGSQQRRAVKEKIAKLEAPAAPAPLAVGELSISSVPSGATVEIAGRAGESWKTPQLLTSLTPGTYKVTVSKPGYATETHSIEVSAGNRASLDVKLNAGKGYLTVGGSPAGASIWIDGRDTGKASPAEFTLDPAAHTITLRKDGFLETTSQIKLSAGQSISFSPSLKLAGRTDNIQIIGGMKKMFGGGKSSQSMVRMEIRTEPKGAQVLINGTILGKTTPVDIQVEPGNYDITLQKDGYTPIRTSVLGQANDKLRIEETFKK